MIRLLILLLAVSLSACGSGDDPGDTASSAVAAAESVSSPADGKVVVDRVESEDATFRVVQLAESLEHAWAVDWLPDGRMLVTERPGQMLIIDESGSKTALSGVPEVWAENQGGLLDVRVAPDYDTSGWIYFSYSKKENGKGGTVVSRAKLQNGSLTDVQEIYRQTPFLEPDYHFGSRIAFSQDGKLIVTLGERGQRRERTVKIPTPSTSVGTTVRLNMDGSVPDDNPFVGQDDARPEVFSYGHRNQQGMAIHPGTGDIWQHEHGPHGGDELNLVEAGNNYGWSAVSYGDTYTTPREDIGGTEAPGVTEPVKYWDPSPALSGMTFYTGDAFPNWENDLFMGALAQLKLIRVELNDDNEVTHQEELLRGELGRIRDVAMGPDGYLYVLTDAPNGGLYRLEPVSDSAES
ncbi:pyrroloquinoline-quinone glucose dehydrogenase [Longibacter salinarum]|uniref:Pyrroloquinoline-quinone glucose dehydrogenase n=1 Tax=Longibacter salinarum TaxID=1850348 RepID=A0A2A8CU95_9BACT|nr:PQQ-dependent sugar dehydrogenase [Longibacter salinarum]PEN11448.1 pyrroloquinoline-quinone glucose dehydrogenase [Longibacter salinarum]